MSNGNTLDIVKTVSFWAVLAVAIIGSIVGSVFCYQYGDESTARLLLGFAGGGFLLAVAQMKLGQATLKLLPAAVLVPALFGAAGCSKQNQPTVDPACLTGCAVQAAGCVTHCMEYPDECSSEEVSP